MSNRRIGVHAVAAGLVSFGVCAGQLMDGHIGMAVGLGLLGLVSIVAGVSVGSSKDGN